MGDFHDPYGAIIGEFAKIYPSIRDSRTDRCSGLSENLKNYRDNLAKTLQAWRNLPQSGGGYYLPVVNSPWEN